MKERIAWITSLGLIDTDYYVVPKLCSRFIIDWYIVKRKDQALDYEKQLLDLGNEGINISYVFIGKRLRSLETYKVFKEVTSTIHDGKYDLIYIELGMLPYFIPVMGHGIDKNKTVLAIHNVHVIRGGYNRVASILTTQYALSKFKNFNVFSHTQFEILIKRAPRKKVYYTPFIPKDYGIPSGRRNCDTITFACFGKIMKYKRVDVLIRAAERLKLRTENNYRIIIAGSCDDWEKYDRLIRHKDLFDLRIHRIPNEDIPNLFNEIDYYVMPYQDIAQSGAMMVAINYEIPIIASKLPAFEECIKEGYNGYLYTPGNVNELVDVMEKVINNHDKDYANLKSGQREYKEKMHSWKSIIEEYNKMFIDVLKNKSAK